MLNPSNKPSANPSRKIPRGGAAQNIKAMPLDWRLGSPWGCLLLDGLTFAHQLFVLFQSKCYGLIDKVFFLVCCGEI
jgi:hypothetical protein